MNFLVPLLIWQGAWGAPQTVSSENLKKLLEEKNSRIIAAKYEAQAAEDRRGYLTRSFLPSFELYAGQDQFRSGRDPVKSQPTYGAEARLNLFRGGRDALESENRDLDSEKRQVQAVRIAAEELEKTRALYWNLIYLKEKSGILNSALDVNKQNLGAAQRRIKSGVATDSDRFEFEMKDVELRQDIARMNLDLNNQSKQMTVVLGLDEGDSILTAEKLNHDHEFMESLKHTGKDHLFLYREHEIEAQQRQVRAKSRSRAWWPSIDAFASYNQYNEREKEFPNAEDRTESVIGVRAHFSFPEGFDSVNEASALRKESQAQSALGDLQKREVEVHLSTEMSELKFLHDLVHEAEENISRAERYYKLTQSEYGRGVKNSPDVLGAADKLLAMRLRRLEIIRDFQLSKAHILSKMGK